MTRQEPQRQLNVTPLAMVQTRRTKSAWANIVPVGAPTMWAGAAGIAKSTVLAYAIAAWTNGALEGDLFGKPSVVAIINGEDDLGSVLVPRLMAAGADLDKVLSLGSVSVVDDRGDWITSPNLADDLKSIRASLIEHGARVLIIDPIISLMSGDSHRLEDVRRNLDPLASMAAELEIAVVCVAHFNKGGGKAGEKVSGSHAFRDIARSLVVMAVDEETDDRILTVEKSNYSPVRPSLAFQIESVDVPTHDGDTTTVGRARLIGPANVTVDDLLKRDLSVLGERSQDLIEYVNEHPEGVRPEAVATALNLELNQARTYLSRAYQAGRIDRPERGRYTPLRNTDTTEPHTVATVASVAFLPKATEATHTTASGSVAKALLCPTHHTPTHDGICGRCAATA